MIKTIFFLVLLTSLFTWPISAQMEIKAAMKKKAIKHFFEDGSSIDVLKIKYKGTRKAIGSFTDPDSIFNMSEGLVLSTGHVKDINRENIKQANSSRNFSRGYDKLNSIARTKTKDAAIIEITFIPKQNYISFNYVFGSEEYPEYVKSTFNDVFAFYLKAAEGGKTTNLAKIPDSNDRIAINQVNHLKNQWYYINNSYLSNLKITEISDTAFFWKKKKKFRVVKTYNIESSLIAKPTLPVEFDGFTKLLQAKSKVTPGEKYVLTICIADAADRIYDTGVLIEAGSFNAKDDENYKHGALANDTNYYFTIDTTLIEDHTKDTIKKVISLPPPCTDTLCTVLYENGSSQITENQKKELHKIASTMNKKGTIDVVISSYCDPNGSANANQKLSLARSKAIHDFLIESKFSQLNVISAKGFGEDPSQITNQQKRRSEIEFKCLEE